MIDRRESTEPRSAARFRGQCLPAWILLALFIASVAPASSHATMAQSLDLQTGRKAPLAEHATSDARGRILALSDTYQRAGMGRFGNYELQLLRFRSNGRLDRSFGTAGRSSRLTIGRPGDFWILSAPEELSDGRIAVTADLQTTLKDGKPGKWLHSGHAIAVFHSSGRLDRAFGRRGVLISRYRFANEIHPEVRATAFRSDRTAVRCGRLHHQTYQGESAFTEGLSKAGKSDLEFASGSRVELAPAVGYRFRTCLSLAAQGDGSVLMLGYDTNDYYGADPVPFVRRYLRDGSLDMTFGISGETRLQYDSAIAESASFGAYLIRSTGDGKSYVLGRRGRSSFVIRLDRNGVIDTTFATGGIRRIDEFCVYQMHVGTDGRITVGGYFGRGNYEACVDIFVVFPAIGRMHASGEWDTSFFGSGYRKFPRMIGGFRELAVRGRTTTAWQWVSVKANPKFDDRVRMRMRLAVFKD